MFSDNLKVVIYVNCLFDDSVFVVHKGAVVQVGFDPREVLKLKHDQLNAK